jgi:cytochrome d ubiquinol oxidase subunit II
MTDPGAAQPGAAQPPDAQLQDAVPLGGTLGLRLALAFLSVALAAVALLAGLAAVRAGREGWAFTGTFVAIGAGVAGLFMALFPDVMPTTLADGVSLTTTNASATHYTLTIMTVVALIFTPLVLLYQAWTYWVFRKRISVHHIPTSPGAGPTTVPAA